MVRTKQARSAIVPSTKMRVPKHTAPRVNERIRSRTEERLLRIASSGPQAVARRLNELDREWDIERMLETNAASLSLLGVALGVTVAKRFFLLPAVVAGFLLQHAIQGWCPPVPMLRRLGFRTQNEIERERYALKALRGDFRNVSKNGLSHLPSPASRALRAAEK